MKIKCVKVHPSETHFFTLNKSYEITGPDKEGWFALIDDDTTESPWHLDVCSIECINRWVESEFVKVEENEKTGMLMKSEARE